MGATLGLNGLNYVRHLKKLFFLSKFKSEDFMVISTYMVVIVR